MLRLASQEARSWAAAGDARFSGAMAAALDARDRVVEDEAEIGVFRFSPGKAAYYASEAYCEVGAAEDGLRRSEHLAQARQQASEALGLLSADPCEQGSELRAAAVSDLAAAYLADGQLDGFLEQLDEVLRLPPEHRTVPVIRRVDRIAGQLEANPSTAVGEDVRDRIALFSAHPAIAPELPAADV